MIRLLQRDEVSGHRIVEIRQQSRINDNGLDWVISYFILDTGLAFTLPMEFAKELGTEEPPADCVVLEHPDLVHVCGPQIVDVLRPIPGSDVVAESPFLLLDNAYLVADVMGAYHGTGFAGIHLFKPGEIDRSQLESFWQNTK